MKYYKANPYENETDRGREREGNRESKAENARNEARQKQAPKRKWMCNHNSGKITKKENKNKPPINKKRSSKETVNINIHKCNKTK